MKQSRRFAVTGGIGSGKSTLLSLFGEMGFPVFSCDAISHELWQEEEYRRSLAELFPSCVRNGEIDRSALTELVFSDEGERKRLEAFSHPRIMERLFSRTDEVPVSFSEVPLLFEGGYERAFDGVIVVVRDDAARLHAAALRDGASEEQIARRMRAQTGKREAGENVVLLENNGTEQALRAKAEELLRRWRLA